VLNPDSNPHMSIVGEKREGFNIMRFLELKGKPECLVHGHVSPFCTCPAAFDMPVAHEQYFKTTLILGWTGRLITRPTPSTTPATSKVLRSSKSV